MESKGETRLLLLAVLTVLVGFSCSTVQTKSVVLHPIEKSDIFSIPATAEIHIKAGTTVKDPKTSEVIELWDEDTVITVEKSGWFLSDYYLSEVVDARVGK